MNQKSSLREDPQFVSWTLTGNRERAALPLSGGAASAYSRTFCNTLFRNNGARLEDALTPNGASPASPVSAVLLLFSSRDGAIGLLAQAGFRLALERTTKVALPEMSGDFGFSQILPAFGLSEPLPAILWMKNRLLAA
jgi:hypothetical protein